MLSSHRLRGGGRGGRGGRGGCGGRGRRVCGWRAGGRGGRASRCLLPPPVAWLSFLLSILS